jgi:hypothetical protein
MTLLFQNVEGQGCTVPGGRDDFNPTCESLGAQM